MRACINLAAASLVNFSFLNNSTEVFKFGTFSFSFEALSRLDASFEALGEAGFATMALLKYPLAECLEYVHTAGNSSGIVDGASLVLIGNHTIGEKLEELFPIQAVIMLVFHGGAQLLIWMSP